ncbi:MAG: hypothetical protein ACJA2P_001324 [Rhodoferax sp.]|jgi:hypothetical protein
MDEPEATVTEIGVSVGLTSSLNLQKNRSACYLVRLDHYLTNHDGSSDNPTNWRSATSNATKKEGIQVICATAWFFGYCIPLPLGQSTELKRPERQ